MLEEEELQDEDDKKNDYEGTAAYIEEIDGPKKDA